MTLRNSQDLHTMKLKDWHRIVVIGESFQKDVQQWSPIASYDRGSQVGFLFEIISVLWILLQ